MNAPRPHGFCDCSGVSSRHLLGVDGCHLTPLRPFRVTERRFARWELTVPARSAEEALRAARLCGLSDDATITEME